MKSKAPSLREERRLLRAGHRMVAAIDEVGRGALAGPVTVGIVVVDADTPSAPAGVRDSKLLTPEARTKIAPRLRRWAPMYAVGHASAQEIDRIGIIAALRLAACRALGSLPVRPDCALLDGSHNWLSIPVARPVADEPALFELDVLVEPFAFGPAAGPGLAEVRAEIVPRTVVTQIKADLRCAAVAAASVLAKVERDAIMIELAKRHPGYGWELNKGYSAPEHILGLRRLGPSDLHRISWNLPGAGGELDPSLFPGAMALDLEVDTTGALDVDNLLAAELGAAGLDEAGLDEAGLDEAGLGAEALDADDVDAIDREGDLEDDLEDDLEGSEFPGAGAFNGGGRLEHAENFAEFAETLDLTDCRIRVR